MSQTSLVFLTPRYLIPEIFNTALSLACMHAKQVQHCFIVDKSAAHCATFKNDTKTKLNKLKLEMQV